MTTSEEVDKDANHVLSKMQFVAGTLRGCRVILVVITRELHDNALRRIHGSVGRIETDLTIATSIVITTDCQAFAPSVFPTLFVYSPSKPQKTNRRARQSAMAKAPHPDPNDSDATSTVSHAQMVSRLFREHNQALIQFLLTRVRSEQEARDVAQEAYVRMLELERPSGVGFLRAYLFKTAANLAVDRARRQSNLHHIHEQWIDPFESLTQAPAAEHRASASQELALVCEYLKELPPRCRAAFYLHRFRDLSPTDIARQLGVSDRMVRSYLVQALVYCRQRLTAARGETTVARTDDVET